MSDTVKLRITIEISIDGEVDTGLTVTEWNALSTAGRNKIADGLWRDEATNSDNGGMSVVTDGAEEI